MSPRLTLLAWVSVVAVLVAVLASGCAPPTGDPADAVSAGSDDRPLVDVDPGWVSDADPDTDTDRSGAAEVLERLAAADTAEVRQRLSILVPDEEGASTYYELDARFDLAVDRAEGTLDSWSDEGEHGPMTTWPDDVPTDSTVRIIGEDVAMRWGGPDDGNGWHDVTALGDTPPVVAHLRSVRPLVGLLADAVDQRAPDSLDGVWRGTVPPGLLIDWADHPGPIGSVSRFTAGMPTEVVDDVHVYEIEEDADGEVRLSLWLDLADLGRNVGESIPEGELMTRIDATWSDLEEPVRIDDPESVADRN